ncbi:glycosyltransferase family 4 protein [Patescibacteria group bacterium]|nr:glycosyltransferase family 4 protein [Patescibacteria group bacterium]
MRIGIDARFFGPKTGGGGIGRYVAELVTHLQEIDHQNEYVIFLRKENFHECVITNRRFFKQLMDVPWYTIREQLLLPNFVRRARVDFMHYPHWNVPIFSTTPFLVTIHDLILIEDRKSAHATTKGALVHGFKYAGFRTVIESAIHRSRHIISISNYSKQSVLNHFGIKEKKISVIPNGIIPAKTAKNVSFSKLGVFEPYFLYVGSAYPHKNLHTMLDAFAKFTQNDQYTQLVIAGRRDVFSQELERYAKAQNISSEQLRFIDFPTDEEVAALYKSARLFIFPSRLEGFGLPPLEAMSHGTPVAAAQASSLPEVLGKAAWYFDPDDSSALARLMQQATDNPEMMATKVTEGLHQSSTFTWLQTAEKTLDLYNSFHLLHK